MNQETQSGLSNAMLKRMREYAKSTYRQHAEDRCAVVTEYLAQLDAEDLERLIKQGLPAMFAAAEREWPESFAGLEPASDEESSS